MDIEFKYQGIDFIADKIKMESNPIKHNGITFEKAAQVFFDPFLMNLDATRNFEERDAVIGFDNSQKLLFVVYVEWKEEYIRLISARRATKEERKRYESI
jgi:uncharacterized protein